jgi:hypothetical protein
LVRGRLILRRDAARLANPGGCLVQRYPDGAEMTRVMFACKRDGWPLSTSSLSDVKYLDGVPACRGTPIGWGGRDPIKRAAAAQQLRLRITSVP